MTDAPAPPGYLDELPPDQRGSLSLYVDLLISLGIDWGLLGPRERDRVWERHVVNSLAVGSLITDGSDVVDLGSGAGLPGIPLALVRPDLRITLLEPLQRRVDFLDRVVDQLSIDDRVRTVRGRAVDHRESYDVVTARAVAPLDRLIRWSKPLMRSNGVLLALKGERAESEVLSAHGVLGQARLHAEVLEVRAFAEADPARVVRVRAKSNTA